MLTKDLLRVSRRGGGYQPQFADESQESVAARVIGCYQGHVGESRETLQEALTDIERESDDFKLVRGFAKLLDRDATWTVSAPVGPEQAREVVFDESEPRGVVTEAERTHALERAATRLGKSVSDVEQSLYADLEHREILQTFDPRWSPTELLTQYNLSLAQTALFDATDVRIRTMDPKAVISQLKRLQLLYEVRKLPPAQRRTVADTDREILVTGPDALFRRTRRYGTRFARLLRTVAKTSEWQLTATIDDRGTERILELTEHDVSVPGVEPLAELGYDSDVEASFARRFEALDLDWQLVREPDPIAAGEYVIIPDFAFDWQHGDFRVYFEIMGFWTPEYVEKKLSRLAEVEETELLVAVDESLGVGEAIEARDHRAIRYTGQVDLGAVRRVLREYEQELVADATARLPDQLTPPADVTTRSELATEYGVSEQAIASVSIPSHESLGQTLVRPSVLEALEAELADGQTLTAATERLSEYGIEEPSPVLAALGYRVEWDGLSGGVLRNRDDSESEQ